MFFLFRLQFLSYIIDNHNNWTRQITFCFFDVTNWLKKMKISRWILIERNVIPVITWSHVCTKQDSAISLWVSRAMKYPKKCLEDLTTLFMSTWWGDSKYMEEIEFSRWLFEGRLRQGKNVLPDGLNWLCYFAGCSKSHRENSISFIYLESPHQVDMKNVVKC